MIYEGDYLEEYLQHFGVLGMKWGVRRPVGSNGLIMRTAGKLKTYRRTKLNAAVKTLAGTKAAKTIGNSAKAGKEATKKEVKSIGNRSSKAIVDALNSTPGNKAEAVASGKSLAKRGLVKVVRSKSPRVYAQKMLLIGTAIPHPILTAKSLGRNWIDDPSSIIMPNYEQVRNVRMNVKKTVSERKAEKKQAKRSNAG